jgi:DNA-binding transcriptional ArsR family regulator
MDAKTPRKKFPGQTDKTPFDLDQVKALASAIRSEVFWAFNKSEPLSAADVAAALGKSAQTVHYHVNELVKVGLLLAVETRKRRARTETLYVHASMSFRGQGPKAPAHYREFIQKGFAAITRGMVRENRALHKVFDTGDDSFAAFHVYNRVTFRTTPEKAIQLKKRLIEVIDGAMENDETPDGIRINVSAYMSPTQAESRNWVRKKGRRK